MSAQAYGQGQIFWVTNATNITRNRIRDAVAKSALETCRRLGFQVNYQSPGCAAVTLWAIPNEGGDTMSLLGNTEIGQTMELLIPRQTDFPPPDGLVPGARIQIGDTWYATDIRYPMENADMSPTFMASLRRLDVTVEVDGGDV